MGENLAGFADITTVAEHLHVNHMTVRREIWAGKLPAFKIRGAWRIRWEDLAEYEQKCRYTPVSESRVRKALHKVLGTPHA